MANPHKRPTALTEAMGNPGHRAKQKAEPKPEPLQNNTAPAYLDLTAKKEWKRVSKLLLDLGLLTDLDTTMLAMYCQAFSDFIRLSGFLTEHGDTFTTGTGYIAQRTEVSLRANAYKRIKDSCCEFGFSPGARARMNVTLEPAKKALTLEDVLNGINMPEKGNAE